MVLSFYKEFLNKDQIKEALNTVKEIRKILAGGEYPRFPELKEIFSKNGRLPKLIPFDGKI